MFQPRMLALAAVGVLSAATLSASPAATAAAPAHTAAKVGGHQTFLFLSTDPEAEEDADGLVLGFGPIHDQGTDHVLSPKKDELEFPDGSVFIRHKVTKGSQHDTFDPATCYGTYREKGSWKVYDGSDTYEDIEGGGRYTVSVTFVGCDEGASPELLFVRITARGSVEY